MAIELILAHNEDRSAIQVVETLKNLIARKQDNLQKAEELDCLLEKQGELDEKSQKQLENLLKEKESGLFHDLGHPHSDAKFLANFPQINFCIVEDDGAVQFIDKGFKPDEILTVFTDKTVQEERARNFTLSMDKIHPPEWLDIPCWTACLYNSDHKPLERKAIIANNMAQMIWSGYFRYEEKWQNEENWTPWGQRAQKAKKILPPEFKLEQDNRKKGEKINQALLDLGLTYGSNASQASWPIGLDYFPLQKAQFETISDLVKVSFSFKTALSELYQTNEWARQILNIGRPECVQEWALMRENPEQPLKVRLDIAFDHAGNPRITEIDGTPGAEGIDAGISIVYQQILGKPKNGSIIPHALIGYEKMAQNILSKKPVLFLITEDSTGYFPEQRLKAKLLAEKGIQVIVCQPSEVEIQGTKVFAKGQEIEYWDRFVETYELNDSKLKALAELSEQGYLKAFPSFSSFFWEGKETLAFLHYPGLEAFWKNKMGLYAFTILKTHTPLTVFPNMLHLDDQKYLVRKRASMDSNLCWGSRGVVLGKKESKVEWLEHVEKDVENFNQRQAPYSVYQTLVDHKIFDFQIYDPKTKAIRKEWGGVRLSPWGYYDGKDIHTCGILAVLRNDDKIHGASNATTVPCCVIN